MNLNIIGVDDVPAVGLSNNNMTFDRFSSNVKAATATNVKGQLQSLKKQYPKLQVQYDKANPQHMKDFGKYYDSTEVPVLGTDGIKVVDSVGTEVPKTFSQLDIDNATEAGRVNGLNSKSEPSLMEGWGGVALGAGQLGLGIYSAIEGHKTAGLQRDLLQQQYDNNTTQIADKAASRKASRAAWGLK